MNYLLDKKIKKRKYFIFLFIVVFLFTLFYFRNPVFYNFSNVANKIFRPIITIGNNIASNFSNINIIFNSKQALFLENKNLKIELDINNAKMTNYNSLQDENNKLKEILGRKKEDKNFVLGTVLNKVNRSLYDSFIIDIGQKNGIKKDDMVFVLGNIPIGRVVEVFDNSSKISLFSSPGQKTEIIISGIENFIEIIGRGGGNFEIILPRDFDIPKGTKVVLPGIDSYVVAISEAIISDPRNSFKKVLLKSPINMQEIKFVQVDIQNQ